MEHPLLIVVEWGELRYKSKVKFFNEVKKNIKGIIECVNTVEEKCYNY